MTQRECYLNSIHTIDQMGEFIQQHQTRKGSLFGGVEQPPVSGIASRLRSQILPALRGVVSSNRRVIAHYADHEDALTFAGSKWAQGIKCAGNQLP